MQKMLYPDSVMVYGVSSSPNNLGRNTVENLERFGFQGTVYMVGHEGGELNGRRIYQHIEDIEAVPDLATFLIPSKAIPSVLERCGKKGIHYALIQSGGFSEFSETGRELEDALQDISRRWNIRFIGPNCIGVINLDNGLVLPFFPILPDSIKKGSVSLISQSGGVVLDSGRLLTLENIGLNKAISIGNKLNLDECDCLEYLITDPQTRSIGLYLENFADGRRLMDLAGQTEKPIVVLKANRSSYSHQIARFHTTALTGDDDIADAALKQSGIYRARTLMEMTDAFKIFSLPPMKGNRVGVVCRSGGQAVMLADCMPRYDFIFAGFSDRVFDYVREKIRAGVIRMTNPLDLGDVFNIEVYKEIMEKVLQEPDVDGVVFGHMYLTAKDIPMTQELIRSAKGLSEQYGKPVAFFMIASKKHLFTLKETCDFPIFADPDRAVYALAVSLRHHRKRRSRVAKQPRAATGVIRKDKGASASAFMDPAEAFSLLRAYAVPVAEFAVAGSLSETCEAAEVIGYPVAMKIAAPEILHKTEAGGVHLGLTDRQAVAEAFQAMKADRVLVQKMSVPGQEVIIGGRQDREFGPVVLFGLGGIFVEVIRDVAMRICPIDTGEAGRMMEEIRGSDILRGFRHQAPVDREALKACIVNISRLLFEHPEVQNLDLNPLLVFGKAQGCLAVDVKIRIEKP